MSYIPLNFYSNFDLTIEPIKDLLEDELLVWALSPMFRNPLYKGKYQVLNDLALKDYQIEDEPNSFIKKEMSSEERKTEWRESFSLLLTLSKWRNHKIVYKIDNDFEKELMKTTGQVKIPYKFLEKLENKCFYIELPKDSYFNELHGMFVNITRFLDKWLIGVNRVTNDTVVYHFFIAMGKFVRGFGTEEYVDNNGEKGFIFNGEIEDWTHKDNNIPVYKEADRINEKLVDCNRFVLQFITYLCAENADIKISDESKSTYHPSATIKDKYSEILKYDVGYNFGKIFREYKKRKVNSYPTGISKRPHIRKAHWHTFYKGKGKTETVIHWLSEIFVNANCIEEK